MQNDLVTCEGVIIAQGQILRSLTTGIEYRVARVGNELWIAPVDNRQSFPISSGHNFSFVQKDREK